MGHTEKVANSSSLTRLFKLKAPAALLLPASAGPADAIWCCRESFRIVNLNNCAQNSAAGHCEAMSLQQLSSPLIVPRGI